MKTLTQLCLVVLALIAVLCVSPSFVSAQNVRITHYPMTLADFAPYLPPEMLAELKKLDPQQQREWAWKETDKLIAKGIIKRQPGWQPFHESVAQAADEMIPGAGKVVRQAVQDVKELKQDAKELAKNPSIHNLAKTVSSATDIPLNAKAGTAQVLKDNADRVLDRNNLSGLKPVAHRAIDGAVNAAVPIPGAVGVAAKVSGFVAKNTAPDSEQVLVCSVGAHEAAKAADGKPKSLLQTDASQMVEHEVDSEAELLWQQGVIPQHSCHYVSAKHLNKAGLSLPPKTQPKKKSAAALKMEAAAKAGKLPPQVAQNLNPQTKQALKQHVQKEFSKKKFVHPALQALNLHAKPASIDKQTKAKTPAKATKNNKAAKPAAKTAKPAAKTTKPAAKTTKPKAPAKAKKTKKFF